MANNQSYTDFIRRKIISRDAVGFEPDESLIHPSLFPYQRDSVIRDCRLGCGAQFLDTGLGKTRVQLSYAQQVAVHTGRQVLVVAPLAVGYQTEAEAVTLGIDAKFSQKPTNAAQIVITNYERLKNFNADDFAGVVLDESSILKSYMGKTKQMLIEMFAGTPYRQACTATPSPNDYLELGNHAQFLGVMESNEMISRWFINDTMAAGNYRLKNHARADFWRWVASWAVAARMPSDLGYSDEGFVLPELRINERIVSTEGLPPVEGQLFRDMQLSATDMHREMRLTAPRRAGEVADLAGDSGDTWVIWCNTDYEADELRKLIPDAVEVRGSDKPESKEEKLIAFSRGDIKKLITKPSIAGFGMNWQHCHKTAFVGLSHSYEMLYQALRRFWRFGQKSAVDAYIVYADSEGSVLTNVKRKQEQHQQMQAEMTAAINEFSDKREVVMETGVQEKIVEYDYTLMRGDCVEVIGAAVADGSIDYSVYSPPFSTLYIYSDDPRDMGNTADDQEFLDQYRFLARELYRATRDGRLTSFHCKDLPRYKGRDGAAGLWDFPGELIKIYESEGWQFHSRVTIWKDPVIEMQRTKNHGLLYKQLCKDSAASRQGMADYVITMRKWGDESKWDSVTRGGERFHDYLGSTMYAPGKKEMGRARDEKERERLFSIAVWQRYASPVWFDIDQTDVLNYQLARDGNDEKHICPLQLGVIERCVELWSNPGDLVLSPFAGIGSEGYVSVKMGRKFVGVELKKSYFDIAARNLKDARARQLDLFAA